MKLELENDSSRDFLDAVLGLRSILARVRVAGELEGVKALNGSDPAVLLLLGLHSVERSLNRWIVSLEDLADETVRPASFRQKERFLR